MGNARGRGQTVSPRFCSVPHAMFTVLKTYEINKILEKQFAIKIGTKNRRFEIILALFFSQKGTVN